MWHLATGPTPPASTPVVVPPPLPDASAAPSLLLPQLGDWGYGRALDWRYTAGSPERLGPAAVLDPGADPAGGRRADHPAGPVLVAADAANGISAELDLSRWLSIPPGMATTMLREPTGEWVHLDCRTQLAADGLGLCSGVLSDEDGAVAEVSQPLLVQQR